VKSDRRRLCEQQTLHRLMTYLRSFLQRDSLLLLLLLLLLSPRLSFCSRSLHVININRFIMSEASNSAEHFLLTTKRFF